MVLILLDFSVVFGVIDHPLLDGLTFYDITLFSLGDFFCFLATLHNMRDPSSMKRDRTIPPAVEGRSLNHWTTREVPALLALINLLF